jgi:hypothetical protein
MQSTRRLLELELGDDQKKVVESVLENALLLQTSLQESGTSGSVRARAETKTDPGDTNSLRFAPGKAPPDPQP